jgi:hypothetical protein
VQSELTLLHTFLVRALTVSKVARPDIPNLDRQARSAPMVASVAGGRPAGQLLWRAVARLESTQAVACSD